MGPLGRGRERARRDALHVHGALRLGHVADVLQPPRVPPPRHVVLHSRTPQSHPSPVRQSETEYNCTRTPVLAASGLLHSTTLSRRASAELTFSQPSFNMISDAHIRNVQGQARRLASRLAWLVAMMPHTGQKCCAARLTLPPLGARGGRALTALRRPSHSLPHSLSAPSKLWLKRTVCVTQAQRQGHIQDAPSKLWPKRTVYAQGRGAGMASQVLCRGCGRTAGSACLSIGTLQHVA